MPTLTALIEQKQHLETQLEDAFTYTEELEQAWQNTELDIARKVDAYGYVIDDLKNKLDFLADKKRKITDIRQRLENEIERIKYRLNQHCNGEKLIGNEYKIHPFNASNSSVDMDLVEDEHKKYIVTMNYEQFTKFNAMCIDENLPSFTYTVKCNVTDLPQGHRAIITKITPSVRIT